MNEFCSCGRESYVYFIYFCKFYFYVFFFCAPCINNIGSNDTYKTQNNKNKKLNVNGLWMMIIIWVLLPIHIFIHKTVSAVCKIIKLWMKFFMVDLRRSFAASERARASFIDRELSIEWCSDIYSQRSVNDADKFKVFLLPASIRSHSFLGLWDLRCYHHHRRRCRRRFGSTNSFDYFLR